MATLIWTDPAVADLEEIGQFISKDSPPAAEKVGSRLIREAENVTAFPRLGRIVPEFGNPQIREIISQSYRIICKFDEEGDQWRSYESGMELEAPLSWLMTLDP
jgi:toxin ParE1/3/4